MMTANSPEYAYMQRITAHQRERERARYRKTIAIFTPSNIEVQTDKAVLIRYKGRKIWLPLKLTIWTVDESTGEITMSCPKWLADEKEIVDIEKEGEE